MAMLIFTSFLALIAIAIAVVPAAVILWQDAHRPAPVAGGWSVLDEAHLVLHTEQRPALSAS